MLNSVRTRSESPVSALGVNQRERPLADLHETCGEGPVRTQSGSAKYSLRAFSKADAATAKLLEFQRGMETRRS